MHDVLTELLSVFTRAANPTHRREAASELAQFIGCDDVIIFISDPETSKLVPAPGFPQTLPGRRTWHRLLEQCKEAGSCQAEVPLQKPSGAKQAVGVAAADGSILVALGGSPDHGKAQEACHFLPLLSAVLKREQAARAAQGRERAARNAASQLNELASALDTTRLQLQEALQAAAIAKEQLEHELEERHRLDEQLRRQTTILQTITDNATTGLIMMDAEGRGTFWNPAAEQMTGFTADEAVGSILHNLFHHHYPDGRPFPIEECPIDRALPERRDVRGYEDVFIRKDGSLFPVLCSAKAIIEDETPIGTIIEVRDLTEQKQAEESLRESERRYRLAARATNDAVWDWDLRRNAVHWNEALGSLFGLYDAAASGTTTEWWEQRIHPDDRDRVITGITAAANGNEDHWQAEYRFRKADDSYAYVFDRGYLIRGPEGDPVRMVGAMLDLSERKEIEESLRDQKRILETINEVNSRLAAELDLDRLIKSVIDAGTELTTAHFGAFFYNMVNEQGESYMLYTLSGVEAEAFADFPMPRNTKVFNPTFQGDGVVRSDDITKDPRYGHNSPYHGMPKGHLPVRSYLAVPVLSRSNEVLGGLFFGHPNAGVFDHRAEQIASGIADQAAIAIENAQLYRSLQTELVERQRAEARLQELNETLEQRVIARTAELEHANKALRRSNRDLQGFANVASHDLQEPLRKMTTFANLLQIDYAARLDDQGIDYLARIESAGLRMSTLLTDLLSFSRVTRETSAFTEVNLKSVMDAVLSDLEVRLQETGGTVEIGSLPVIHADASQMHQLLLNLVGNGLKFARSGVPPNVRVEHREVVNDDDPAIRWCSITVSDNGIGFDNKYRERIFAPFQRLHANDSDYPGTGMGLSICQRIVEHHGGRISVESAPGEGATFTVELPFRQRGIS